MRLKYCFLFVWIGIRPEKLVARIMVRTRRRAPKNDISQSGSDISIHSEIDSEYVQGVSGSGSDSGSDYGSDSRNDYVHVVDEESESESAGFDDENGDDDDSNKPARKQKVDIKARSLFLYE